MSDLNIEGLRRQMRFPPDASDQRVQVTTPDGQRIGGTVLDVSKTGLGLILDQPVSVGKGMRVRVRYHDYDELCEVCNIRRGSGLNQRIGVEFVTG